MQHSIRWQGSVTEEIPQKGLLTWAAFFAFVQIRVRGKMEGVTEVVQGLGLRPRAAETDFEQPW